MVFQICISPIYSEKAMDYEIADEEGERYEIEPDSFNLDGEEVYNWNGKVYHSV